MNHKCKPEYFIKRGKIAKFAEYMSTFDYQGLIQISKNIYELVKNTKVDVNIDNNLSSIIKSSYPSLNVEEIDTGNSVGDEIW